MFRVVLFTSVSILLLCIPCKGQQIVGNSDVRAGSIALGQVGYTDTVTTTTDNINFSEGLSTASFAALDASKIIGASNTTSVVTRGDGQNIFSGASGFANSFLYGINPDRTGVVGEGASSVLAFASEESAGVDAVATTEAALYNTDEGYLLFQNQAGGTAFTKYGNAQYNYTSGLNVTGSNATVSELVNVRLVSNKNQTTSQLILCQGSAPGGCTSQVPGP